jgi:hypothetical protein
LIATKTPGRLLLSWRLCFVVAALLLGGCKRKHIAVDSVPELPYPKCEGARETVAKGKLRSGPVSREKDVVERFELARTACGYVFAARQEWGLSATDVEVIFDDKMAPLRAWKRMTIPGSPRPDGHADIRRYEMRSSELSIKKKTPEGETLFEILKVGGKTPPPAGTKPAAVVGPGRGVMTAWLKRAKLPVGGKARELALDFRDMVERLEEVTLTREADLDEPSLGRKVRVYTVYGRDTVFADDDDVVIGDLAGLRPADSVKTPEPPPVKMYGDPDPVGTP